MGKCDARGRGGAGLSLGLARGLVLALVWSGGAALADCAPGAVELRSDTGAVARFSVEVADDDAERATGLMNRPHMAMSRGMLFIYESPRQAFFWMKNTLIPLDMIFADATGKVQVVHEMAQPLDETAIDGGPDVVYVLEINGGLARRLGIAPGAVMRSPLIPQEGAAWPCGQ